MTSGAEIERALLAGLRRTDCLSCGDPIPAGSGYCDPCAAAVDRLNERGYYFADHTREWSSAILEERKTVE